jgi:hypothetical protein
MFRRDVRQAFHGNAATPAPSSVTVDVYNGGGTPEPATQASQALAALGYKAGKTANSSAQPQPVTAETQVFYGTGAVPPAPVAPVAGLPAQRSRRPRPGRG